MKPNQVLSAIVFALALALPRIASSTETLAPIAPATAAVLKSADPAACAPVPLTHVQRRVLERSAQGIGSLRQYVQMTSSIHMLDFNDTVAWADAHRARAAACGSRVAAGAKN